MRPNFSSLVIIHLQSKTFKRLIKHILANNLFQLARRVRSVVSVTRNAETVSTTRHVTRSRGSAPMAVNLATWATYAKQGKHVLE